MTLNRTTEKKVRMTLYLLLGLMIFLITTTLSGIWTALDRNIVNMSTFVDHFNKNVLSFTYIKLSMNFDFPPNILSWIFPALMVMYLIVPYMVGGVKDEQKYEQRSEYASHGSARWQTDEEIQKHYYQSKHGIILGDVINETYYPMQLDDNK